MVSITTFSTLMGFQKYIVINCMTIVYFEVDGCHEYFFFYLVHLFYIKDVPQCSGWREAVSV